MKIEPEKHEFQGRDGKWCTFMDDAHYQNTVEDGSWPIRALYTEAQMRQLGEACAQVAGPEDSYQDEWFNAKADAVNKINARIKELLS